MNLHFIFFNLLIATTLNQKLMVKLVKGQFAIINVDTVWHGSITFDNEPRDMLNMIVKWNPWLHELTRSKPIVDIERIKL